MIGILPTPIPGATGDHLIDTLRNFSRVFGMGRYDARVIATAVEEILELRATVDLQRRKIAHRCIDIHCEECQG